MLGDVDTVCGTWRGASVTPVEVRTFRSTAHSRSTAAATARMRRGSGLSLLGCHAGDGAQVGPCLVGVILDLDESEMCEGVELVAQADQAT